MQVEKLKRDISCHLDICKVVFLEDNKEKGLYETLQEVRRTMTGRLLPDATSEFRTSDILPTNQFMSNTSKGEDVEHDMDTLSEDYESLRVVDSQAEYVDKAIDIFARLLQIHPYSDGNGRTARALLDIMLVNRDIVPPILYDTYYDRDILDTKVMEYLAKGNKENLKEYIKGQISNSKRNETPFRDNIKEERDVTK